MTEVTPRTGFEIFVDASYGVVVRVWGFWDLPRVVTFSDALQSQTKSMQHPWFLLLDCTGFVPQKAEVYQEFSLVMKRLQNVGEVLLAVSNAITRLQLRRLSTEISSMRWSFFATREDAQRVFEQKKLE